MDTEEKQKVLFLITKSNWGGAQRYVYDLATNLDPEQFIPTVALGGEGILKDKLLAAQVRSISIPGLQRNVSLFKEIKATISIGKIIKAERPDVLHINSSKAGILGALVGRILGVPKIVFTAHGWAFNEPRPYWQYLVIKCVHWLTVLLAHNTIVVSHATKAQMDWVGAQPKMTVVHPGRSDIAFKNRPDARGIIERSVIPGKYGLVEFQDDLWVGIIAELHPIKNHQLLLSAWSNVIASVPHARLVIIGEGELLISLQQQVVDLGIEQHVFFTGHLDEAARFLKAFDIFTLPSQSEAYGYVLAEAGLAGVPVVAANVGGITDVVTHRENGLLFSLTDQKTYSDHLIELLQNQSLRKRLGKEHQNRMSERTIEKMIYTTQIIYTHP